MERGDTAFSPNVVTFHLDISAQYVMKVLEIENMVLKYVS